MSGAIRGCGVLSRESRAQAGELVVTHPFSDEFFEQAKRLARRIPHSVLWKWLGGFFPKALGEKL
jgi:hypothetical protein